MHTENSINDINSICLDDIVNFIMVKIKKYSQDIKNKWPVERKCNREYFSKFI